MQFLELRRHSTRTPDTEHLSQAGVARARRVGESLGPFARVVASPSSWTYETAIAMGFAVDERYLPVALSEAEWEALGQMMPPGTPLEARAQILSADPLGRKFADALRGQWAKLVSQAGDRECFLVVTHGGYIDNSAVACLPDAPHATWGECFAHCEGIRLAYEQGRFMSGTVLRVP